jgi:2-hydroxychromene-2-carboxylate isomerase
LDIILNRPILIRQPHEAEQLKTVEVYFDYASPFAYVASEVLPDFANRVGILLSWKPINLQQLSNYENGLPYSPLKRRYVVLDAARSAEYHGVPIEVPRPFPVESMAALRLAGAAHPEPGFLDLHRALFRAAWREQLDISSRDVLSDCIGAGKGPVDKWLAKAEQPEAIEDIDSLTSRAESLGIFGVPAMLLDGEQFWGLDSLPVLEWRLMNPRPAA